MTVGRGVRRGAHMSTKVLARAAYDGRRLSILINGVPSPIRGYLVGMDDFHLHIAEVEYSNITLALIHKSAPVIAFSNAFLKDEPQEVQTKVTEIGQAFWDFCAETHLGRNGNKESQ